VTKPQQPEVRRSGTTPIDPDSIGSELDARRSRATTSGNAGPVPEDNQPGHHPPHEQDKPDLEEFRSRFTADHDDEPEPEPPAREPTVDDSVAGPTAADEGTQWRFRGAEIVYRVVWLSTRPVSVAGAAGEWLTRRSRVLLRRSDRASAS
jgi:hypothetical protein